MPVSTIEAPACAFDTSALAANLVQLNTLSGGVLEFCHNHLVRIDLTHLKDYFKIARSVETCIFNSKRKKTDKDLRTDMGRARYEAYWRCLMAWFIGVALENKFCLPMLTITMTTHLLGYEKGVINANNFKHISFQKRMAMIKKEVGHLLQTPMEYDYGMIIRDVYRQYYKTWDEWPVAKQEHAEASAAEALQVARDLAKKRGTFHESTLVMTTMHVVLQHRDQQACNTAELGRVLGVSEKNFRYESGIGELRKALEDEFLQTTLRG